MRSTIKIEDVTVGTTLVADDGFTCLNAGQHCKVRQLNGQLFVHCRTGSHFLDGQLDDDGTHYVGFSKQPAN